MLGRKTFHVRPLLISPGVSRSRTAGQSAWSIKTISSPFTWEPAYFLHTAVVLGFLGEFCLPQLDPEFSGSTGILKDDWWKSGVVGEMVDHVMLV